MMSATSSATPPSLHSRHSDLHRRIHSDRLLVTSQPVEFDPSQPERQHHSGLSFILISPTKPHHRTR
ncbi:uncharacterized protein BDZ99DRAFT_456549 [Mytilinidion resinicola]|uniref:Uncharacterized protein n=1 Tax=Mytilinidion resinicola TaxID=574789 RepID=A0A6A6Z6S4_9PEZI|nr:uncharacterized protein BDZ99DRAFT_456549 [Mytilinidion resinicola]KAF2816730.1 hypothetical protein BDZ99DRAFT_456549 [Mytilinidion resinicola]